MDFEFSSKEELFLRVRPALIAKSSELSRLGYSFVTDVDIWNYLINIRTRILSQLLIT